MIDFIIEHMSDIVISVFNLIIGFTKSLPKFLNWFFYDRKINNKNERQNKIRSELSDCGYYTDYCDHWAFEECINLLRDSLETENKFKEYIFNTNNNGWHWESYRDIIEYIDGCLIILKKEKHLCKKLKNLKKIITKYKTYENTFNYTKIELENECIETIKALQELKSEL